VACFYFLGGWIVGFDTTGRIAAAAAGPSYWNYSSKKTLAKTKIFSKNVYPQKEPRNSSSRSQN
jgi:hypothetical protein